MEFKYYLNLIWRRRLVFSAILLVTLAIPVILSIINGDVYRASARVFINEHDIKATFFQNIPDELGKLFLVDPSYFYDSYTELLDDSFLLQQLVDELDLDIEAKSLSQDYPYLSFLTLSQDVAINISRVEETDLYEIQGFSKDISQAEKIVNTHLDNFIKRSGEIYRDSINEVIKILEYQEHSYYEDLKQAETTKITFITSSGVTGSDSQINELHRDLHTYEYDLHKTEIDLYSLQDTQETIKATLAKIPELEKTIEEIEVSPTISYAKQKLVDLFSELAANESDKTADHPDVIALKSQIKILEEQLTADIEKLFSLERYEKTQFISDFQKDYWQNEIDLVIKQAEFSFTQDRIAKIKDDLARIAIKNSEYDTIQNTIDRLRGNLNTLQESLDGAKMARQMDFANTVVYYYAETQPEDADIYFPDWPVSLFLSLFIGFVIAFFAILLLEYVDESCKRIEEIEKNFDSNAFLTIPPLRRKQIRSLFDGSYKKSPKLQRLIWNIGSLISQDKLLAKAKMYSVVSSRQKEGKSITSLLFTHAFTELGNSTLIISFNPGRSTTETNSGYLSEWIDGRSELADIVTRVSSNADSVSFCPPGEIFHRVCVDNNASIFFKKLLEQSKYDRIIFELHSVAESGVSLVISERAEAVLFLARLHKSNREDLKKSGELPAFKNDADNSRLIIAS